jgi:hypothetical protein
MVHVRFGGEGLVCLGDQDPASYPTSDLGKPLSKDAPLTARMITVELAHVQMQEHLHVLN